MFNRRKMNEGPMEAVEGVNNDDEMSYGRGTNTDNSNFESFPREFGKLIFV